MKRNQGWTTHPTQCLNFADLPLVKDFREIELYRDKSGCIHGRVAIDRAKYARLTASFKRRYFAIPTVEGQFDFRSAQGGIECQ
jgi:hypothetical protein